MSLIYQNATAESVRFLRFYVFGIFFASVLADPLIALADLPASIFTPVGPFWIFPAKLKGLMLTPVFLHGLKLATLAALAWALFTRRIAVPALFAAVFCVTVYQSVVRGFGHVNHDDIPMMYAAYAVAFFAWADKRAAKDPSAGRANLYSVPWVAALGALLFCYSFTGMYRLFTGGIGLFFSDTLKAWMVYNSHRPSFFFLWDLVPVLDRYPWLYLAMKAGFPVVTALEIFAPFCLVSRRFRTVFLAVMLPFFALNWLFMNVLFWQNLALCILLFDRVFEKGFAFNAGHELKPEAA